MLRSHRLRLYSVTGGIYLQGVQKNIKNIKDITYTEYAESTHNGDASTQDVLGLFEN
jgi:hypothetical protein